MKCRPVVLFKMRGTSTGQYEIKSNMAIRDTAHQAADMAIRNTAPCSACADADKATTIVCLRRRNLPVTEVMMHCEAVATESRVRGAAASENKFRRGRAAEERDWKFQF